MSVRRLATNRIAASSYGFSVSTLVTVDAMLDEHVCVSITWRKNGRDETWIRRRLLVADQPIDAIADDDLQGVRTWRYAVSLHVDVCAE